jgi:transposase
MPYTAAGIDIHKKVLMVVVAIAGDEVADPAGEAIEFECRRCGTGASERKHVVTWLRERGVTEVVMESTAQYWKPVWLEPEPHFAKLHLAQAHSNRAPKGRKNDFRDAKRLTRRLLTDELILSFVPDAEQRSWRTATRGKPSERAADFAGDGRWRNRSGASGGTGRRPAAVHQRGTR